MSCNNNKLTDNAIDIFFNYNIVSVTFSILSAN